MSKHNSLQKIIEGALMVSHEPLTLQEIANLFDDNKPSKNEIKQIKKKVSEKKLSIVPIKLFINNRGYVKLEIGLGKGKKSYDKREDIKKRDIDRNLRERLKNI